ncbi:MAG: MMPL family transporter, partial [Actinomycetota bacterium]|nr:MMPL family transporter [Actinomycetota bacterium]
MSRRLSWLTALLILVASGAAIGLLGGGDSGASPVAVPAAAESARADAARSAFPGADRAPVILVITRDDGAPLSPADLQAVDQARQRMLSAADTAAGPPTQVSEDGRAALAAVPLDAGLSGFALSDEVTTVRDAADDGLPAGLRAEVTGGPAFGADIADSFSGANVTLLAVTAAVVALLLIITYRSPTLWLVPLLVIAFADRVAATLGSAVAEAVGVTPDGSTSGITSVLVFGAGTNYALLLISRYREELGREQAHLTALDTAVRRAAPAIVASNATVVLALLTLLLATAPSTRSLGVQAASGLVVAAVFVLLVLPPLLGLFGRKLFWPFIPRVGATALTDSGAWHRIAAGVSRRPGPVAAVSIGVLAVLCTGLLATPFGLSQTEQFRVQAESVDGYNTLAEHFPSGLTDPTVVIASAERADAVQRAIAETPGVVSVAPAGTSDGLRQ